MATAPTRQVFVLGREVDQNREVLVVDANTEYTISSSALVEYSDDTAQFPYEV